MRQQAQILLRIAAFGVLGVVAGCSKEVPPEPVAAEPVSVGAAPAASTGSASSPTVLRVDPGLIDGDRIRIERAKVRPIDEDVPASGEVVPSVEGEARMGAMISGRIVKVLVREGDAVKKGQILAWIDAPEAARMQGDFLRARARVWRAEQALARQRALWEDRATSESALQQAEADVRAAKAEEAAARGLLASTHVPAPRDDARYAAARIGVASPLAGVVSKRHAVVGDHVGLEDTLFEVVDPSKLMIRADVPEVAARRVRPGSRAWVMPRGAEEGCPGRVRSKLEAIDRAKRTMGVMVEVEPTCQGLVAGGFVDVNLTIEAAKDTPRIVVPRAAVVDLDGDTAVFVQKSGDDRGAFEVRRVKTGLSDGERVVVEEGLVEGERIVVAGTFLLKGERMKSALGGE